MQLLKERGVKPGSRIQVASAEGQTGQDRFSGRGEAANPLARVIQKLERAVGMVREKENKYYIMLLVSF